MFYTQSTGSFFASYYYNNSDFIMAEYSLKTEAKYKLCMHIIALQSI